MVEPPGALYKYLTAERARTVLANLQIRFSQASVLNDGTELKPPFKGIAAPSDLTKILTDRLRKKYPDLVKRVEQARSSEEAALLIDDTMAKAAAQAQAAFPQNAEKIYAELERNFGTLSLSETPISSVLWGITATVDTAS